jgi:hypothetical protein
MLDAEITLFAKDGGPLTKTIALDSNGGVTSDASQCYMARGMAARVAIPDVSELGTLLHGMNDNNALALGSLRAELPRHVNIVTKSALNGGAPPDTIARTKDNLVYRDGARGFVLLDFDTKGVSAAVAGRLNALGGFVPAIASIMPRVSHAARLVRASTSAGLYRQDNGQAFTNSRGLHVYLAVWDVSDSERFLKTLHARCWLNGLGWLMVGAAGQLLERSIVDRMVGAPERLVFEGPPVLVPPLAQDQAARKPLIEDGGWLDTAAACPPLSIVERSRLTERHAKAAHALDREAADARNKFLDEQTETIARRCGITTTRARHIAIRQINGILLPVVTLPFDDQALAGKTVADVLAYPDAYDGETLADPLEGVSYGRCKAKIMRRDDGTPWIHSFAHCRTIYALKHDAAAVQAILYAAPQNSGTIGMLIRHILTADLDAVEIEELIAIASRLTGTGIRVIKGMLKATRKAQAEKEEEEKCRQRKAARNDPRPCVNAPAQNAPWLPEMGIYDEILCAVTDDIPPSRHADDELNCARCTVFPGTHAFSSDGTDEPPAPQWHIRKLNENETADLLEKHIDFIDPKDGLSVQCPTKFVNHYRGWGGGALPKLVAISTLPLVLGNGEILAPKGLDRLRGIAFMIDDKLRNCLPRERVRDDTRIAAALKFLAEDWMIDVKCTFVDKCNVIALALTIIERSLLAERPIGFITSPTPESGKTTLAKMLITAVTGADAVAFAWSPHEEERRKALLAYFDAGLTYILWDNIADGTFVQCPNLERSCTASHYADRKLGVSEFISAAAATVDLFTGNNIAPRGAMSSRTVHVRVDTDLVDPMARKFEHNDPIAWTKSEREKILGALYTILLGNPMLDTLTGTATKTRFPMWYRLVGSAVEHAGRCYEAAYPQEKGIAAIEYDQVFAKQKTSDEEGTGLGEMFHELDEIMHGWRRSRTNQDDGNYPAKEIAACLNQDYGLPGSLSHGVAIVRGFLFQKVPLKNKISPHAVTRALGAYMDRRRIFGSEELALRACADRKGAKLYYIERIPLPSQG